MAAGFSNDQIQMLKDGDINLFKNLVDQHKNLVYSVALRFTRQNEDAEEIAQDVFIKVFRNIRNFNGTSKLSTWIYSIAYNTCLDWKKKNDKQIETETIEESTLLDLSNLNEALDTFEKKDLQILIDTCLSLVSSEQGALLTMFYLQEMSLIEIAEVVKLKPNNVKVKLHRSRLKLASLMQEKFVKERLEV